MRIVRTLKHLLASIFVNLTGWGKGDHTQAVSQEILRFQPDTVLLERAKPPLGARITLYFLAALIILSILWSFLGKIDKIVVAEGKIATVSTPVILQSYSISIVKDIKVTMGQKVKKDELLVVLDPTFAQADMSQLQERAMSLTIHCSRLQCELDGLPFPPAKEGEQGAQNSSEQRELRVQADIYSSRHEEYSSRVRTFDEQRKKLSTGIEATIADLKRRRERLKIFAEFEDMRRKLYEQGIEARAGYLEVKKDRLTVESDVLRLESSIQEQKFELSAVESDRAAYITGWRSATAQEMVSVRRDLDQTVEQLSKAKKMGDLVNIRAPMDAVVLEVAKRNSGSVVDEAETLVTLVPANAPLEIEAEIQPQDVGYVHAGQTARVKLMTLPFQQHGKIDATLVAVSEDSFLKKTGTGEQNVYRGKLALPPNPLETLRNLHAGFALLPGMAATVEINVGERRIIEYFLYPILAGFDQGLREPR